MRTLFFLIFLPYLLWAQPIWNAAWIAHPDADPDGFGVYHFRKKFDIGSVPASAAVNVTADNRYRLYVNGQFVCMGPQRGDVQHWRYETVDIAPFLVKGENVVAALVHHSGPEYPMAQTSDRVGFLLQADGLGIHTSKYWYVFKNTAYDPVTLNELKWWEWAGGWYACGFTDELDAKKYPWGWEQTDFDDTGWRNAVTVNGAWQLEPRRIPLLEHIRERFVNIRRSDGIRVPAGFVDGEAPFTIPPETTATILFDMGRESVGLPELETSGGRDARIKITYAESLFDQNGEKGDRNVIECKKIRGYWDVYHADGGENRLFRPLWLRTFRYVQLDITTQSHPLTIHDYYQVFTAYPFEQKASFQSNDSSLDSIWDTAWRTMRCCALETYTDCPYYEQLNYPGDTRLQAYCSLYLSGDDRLMRDAIRLMSYSQMENGLTQAAYPIRKGREIKIPTYALFWISMLHDYYILRDDVSFIQPFLPQLFSNLQWFKDHLDETGLLYGLEMWNFVDWSFPDGTPNGAKRKQKGRSGFVSLQFAYTLDQAAELVSLFGYHDRAADYTGLSAQIKEAVNTHCYDSRKHLYADSPEKKDYSQHTNIFAVLTNTVAQSAQPALMQRILETPDLVPCSSYFSFYLFKALQKTGKADLFLDRLGLWKKMLEQGLTTFGESGGDLDRSDCHAWSAHPAYFFLSLVCGILPAEPGFKSVLIQPALGKLGKIKAQMPHPGGMIDIDLQRSGNGGLDGTVLLPGGLTGRFIWHDKIIPLKSGTNAILPEETATGDVDTTSRTLFLGRNYPNPFQVATTIPYHVPAPGPIRMAIYNTRGRLVTTIFDKYHARGQYEIKWNGTVDAAGQTASGLYFCRLCSSHTEKYRKILILR